MPTAEEVENEELGKRIEAVYMTLGEVIVQTLRQQQQKEPDHDAAFLALLMLASEAAQLSKCDVETFAMAARQTWERAARILRERGT